MLSMKYVVIAEFGSQFFDPNPENCGNAESINKQQKLNSLNENPP